MMDNYKGVTLSALQKEMAKNEKMIHKLKDAIDEDKTSIAVCTLGTALSAYFGKILAECTSCIKKEIIVVCAVISGALLFFKGGVHFVNMVANSGELSQRVARAKAIKEQNEALQKQKPAPKQNEVPKNLREPEEIEQ